MEESKVNIDYHGIHICLSLPERHVCHPSGDSCKRCKTHNCAPCNRRLVMTDQGFYCAQCLDGKLLMYPDNREINDKYCDICKKYQYNTAIYVAKMVFCRSCLEKTLEKTMDLINFLNAKDIV